MNWSKTLSTQYAFNLYRLLTPRPCYNGIGAALLHTQGVYNKSSKFPQETGPDRVAKQNEEFLRKHMESRMDTTPPVGRKMDTPGQIFKPYVPYNKKAFILTPSGARQRYEATKAFFSTMYALFKIRRVLKTFETRKFALASQKRFIDMNNALQLDTPLAKRIVEENVVLKLGKQLKNNFNNPASKVHWQFVKQLYRPRIVAAQVAAVEDKKDLYAQITVKMDSEQIIAVKDRYGRVIKGDVKIPKRMIDIIVFEQHIADPKSTWRICGKLAPRDEPFSRFEFIKKLISNKVGKLSLTGKEDQKLLQPVKQKNLEWQQSA